MVYSRLERVFYHLFGVGWVTMSILVEHSTRLLPLLVGAWNVDKQLLFYGSYAGDLELLWVLCNIPIRSKGL